MILADVQSYLFELFIKKTNKQIDTIIADVPSFYLKFFIRTNKTIVMIIADVPLRTLCLIIQTCSFIRKLRFKPIIFRII